MWKYCQAHNLEDCNLDSYDEAVTKFHSATPGPGAYFNEADYNEPDWQEAFWGSQNHVRLSDIKNQWDPDNIFHCYHCIGLESWTDYGMCKLD